MNPEPFFDYAQERHRIYNARQDGATSPWTNDPILHKFKFCNVFRELDVVTMWFNEHVRGPLKDSPDVLLATVLFRFFNRVTTGEAIFVDGETGGNVTAWECLLNFGSSGMSDTKKAILSKCGTGPYVTGSYIIKSPNGMDKLTGVLWAVEQFMTSNRELLFRGPNGNELAQNMDHKGVARRCINDNSVSLEQMWNWLKQFPYLGDFTAYEIVTDLRHTALLSNAPDIYTWANPGPGAMRGLNRLYGRDKDMSQRKHVFICEMRNLLEIANKHHKWPANPSGLPVEMRDIEHTLCEFDKYERVRLGQGRPRGVYRHVSQ